MFLYENSGQFIDVYKLVPKLDEIVEFKRNAIQMIPKTESVWRASTDYNPYLEESVDIIDAKNLNSCNNHIWGTDFHDFRTVIDGKQDKYLILYLNECKCHRCYRIRYTKLNCSDKPRYIVLLHDNYDEKCLTGINPEYIMNGIISVPRTLYLLEVFLNERFDLLKDEEIYNLLNLFQFEYCGRVNVSVLKEMCEYGLVCNSYNDIMERTYKNKDVLVKVKAICKIK